MKKFFASVFVLMAVFCLTACSAPMKTAGKRENKLNCPFTAKMTVELDKLCAEGTVSRYGEGRWEAIFDSPNTLSGVRLTFNEGNVTAEYKGLSFSVPKSAMPVKAMLLNLMDAVDTAAKEEELSGTEKDGLLAVTGSLEGGDYTLYIDEKGCISSFEMPNNKLKISFSEVSVNSPQTAEAPTEQETAAPETETAD